MTIDVAEFLQTLPIMLKGMAGIFIVVGLIILVLLALEKLGGKKEEK